MIHEIEDGKRPLDLANLDELAVREAGGGMNIDFDGKTVIVTGAAHGFGRAIAWPSPSRGAQRSRLRRQRSGLDGDRNALRREARWRISLDVGDRAAVQTVVAAIEAEAARSTSSSTMPAACAARSAGRSRRFPQADWQTIFDVNLSGAFFMAQAVAPAMKQRKFGRIVNISSGAGLGISLTGIQAYASAKAGQIGLTRQLAHELGPGTSPSTMSRPVSCAPIRRPRGNGRRWARRARQKLLQNIALKRLGTPDDIAAMVMFFASDYAGWISGQVLSVDGGK